MQTPKGITLVSGGSQGIGLAITQQLLEQGHQVISLGLAEPDGLQHSALRSVIVDLADRKETEDALTMIASNNKILNVVHNAGVIRPALIEDVSLEDLDYLSQLHLGAMVAMVQAALPAMKAEGFGRIVGVSSRGALGLQTRTNYAATKAGMFGMLRTWALELGEHGITANCVAPGPIETPMFDDIMQGDKDRISSLANAIPVKRLGGADDVANAVKFFIDPDSSFVTGQILYVCGGTSIGSVVI